MRHPLLVAASLVLAACAPSSPQPESPAAEAPPTEAPAAASGAVAAAQQKWQASRPAAYAYDLEISCFCIHRGQYLVEVRGEEITSVRDKATGQPAAESRVEWIVTVDRLFEVMRQASSAGTPVRATYDATLGYPTEAEVGLLANDSGTLYRIGNLRSL
jgi:hypothetical protein